MRHNRLPMLLTSDMFPNRVSLHPGERPQVACPFCDRWRLVERGMLRPHEVAVGPAQKPRCPGSGQRVRINETSPRWRARLAQAAEFAARRR